MYKIQLKYEGNTINIELDHRISVLSDDSGVGKTYIAKSINSALKVKKYNTINSTINNKNCDVHVVFENTAPDEINRAVKQKQSIIIIDEADKVIAMNEHIVKDIVQNKESVFLLILRGDPDGLVIGPNQYLMFIRDDKSITIKPFKSKVDDFFKGV